jgi:hypothetical protein
VFGRAWSGLELPRHLCHFTPGALSSAVERAGGRVEWCRHQTKPRHYLWSARIWLRDHGADALARATERRPIYGALKLLLEVTLPLVSLARLGEVIRIGAVPWVGGPEMAPHTPQRSEAPRETRGAPRVPDRSQARASLVRALIRSRFSP